VVRNGLPLQDLPVADPARVESLRAELDLRPDVPVLGVLARRKSQEELVLAAARLGRPVEILLAGFDEDAGIREAAAALPPPSRVRCLGFRPDTAEICALLDVFVLPSTIEGFSLALLEAMARGLPCVASDAGGNREALAGDVGRLYAPGDVDALAATLRALLDDPDAARRLGVSAAERARSEFDVARTVERTEAVYERAGQAA
jgi:glycosyltransferase involved in cell wall biosynthesis